MVNFLYTNIGRGHPFYLDGVVELLKQDGRLKFECHDVFDISKDPALTAWRMARWLYRIGSTDSVIGKWYNSFRDKSEYNKNSLAMRTLGQDLRKRFLRDTTPLIVDHPVLAGILKGKKNLLYQHGEFSVPSQAVVEGIDYIFVPLESTADAFVKAGYQKEKIIVTGLCIEPQFVKNAETNFKQRIGKYNLSTPLTGGFFTSGAEPGVHLKKLILAVASVLESGGRAIVFARADVKLHKEIKKKFVFAPANLNLATYKSREELDAKTTELFREFDYFVAPSHERTNWALGIGLPMFILDPPIGPFAPINREALLDAGVAKCIESPDEAAEFAVQLAELRNSGRLSKMAAAGWGKHPILGFRTIADFLTNKYATKS